jgi:hypothetical protein
MKAQKQAPSHTVILEKLFNDIFQAPDLKKEVLDYVQPGILQIHQMMETPSFLSAVGFEEKRQIENLLYRDLPNIVSDYTSLDVAYRNEKLLKNNLTHRENLMESLRFVLAKMNDLKNSAFTSQDTKANTIPQILEAKYGQVQTQIEPLKTGYNWNDLKASLPQKHLEQSGFIKKPAMLDEASDQQKVTLVDGKVQYRAKNLRASVLMRCKNLQNKYHKLMQNYKFLCFKYRLRQKWKMMLITTTIGSGFVVGIYQGMEMKHAKATFASVIHEMDSADNFFMKSRDAGMAQLVKMGNPNSLYYENNLKVNVDGMQVTARLSKVNRWTCEAMHNYLNEASLNQGYYMINGQKISSAVTDRDQYASDKHACNKIFDNEVSIQADMRTYEERQADHVKQAMMNAHQNDVDAVKNAQEKLTEAQINQVRLMREYQARQYQYQAYRQQSYHPTMPTPTYHGASSAGSYLGARYGSYSSSAGYRGY